MSAKNDIILNEDMDRVLRQIIVLARRIAPVTVSLLVALLGPFSADGASLSVADSRPRIVAFGDSLTAGLGVQIDESYPAQLQRRLDSLGYHYRVINAGVSGDTTAGGLRRVSWILNSKPELVILELGANDGLRGLPVADTHQNLQQIIRRLQEAQVTVILAGMKLPPNYGQGYTAQFEAMYRTLAKEHQVPFIPFFLEGVGGASSLNQADGLHPTSEGYKVIVEHMLKVLRPVLNKKNKS
jgi:acyl-CoA thioesterase-1